MGVLPLPKPYIATTEVKAHPALTGVCVDRRAEPMERVLDQVVLDRVDVNVTDVAGAAAITPPARCWFYGLQSSSDYLP